ncbi:MAG: hypothetical protein WDA27_11330 [Actinomycetota bacterium]
MIVDPFDLASVFALRELLGSLDPDGRPEIRMVGPVPKCESVAILSGSFNPPTAAHLLLAERALAEGYECVVFAVAIRTAGKQPQGLTLEDRLLALRGIPGPAFRAGAFSHGLYADQAEAAARAFPGAEVAFLVGSDKVLQVLDPKWYPDREAALERLFSLACFIVAPRGDQGEGLRAALEAPENRAWADRVEVLCLHPAVGDLSSTRVRGLLRAGGDPAGLVPSAVAPFLADVKAFAPPMRSGSEDVDFYALRTRLIDLLWESRGTGPVGVDLRHLMRIAISPGDAGRRLRGILDQDPAEAVRMLRAAADGADV